MNREQFKRLLEANARIVLDQRRLRGIDPMRDPSVILVIGSQSVHGQFSDEDLPERAAFSIEADLAYIPGRDDVFFFDDPEEDMADYLDSVTGEGSVWQDRNGFYSQGVTSKTACLPEGWRDRLVDFDDPDMPRGIQVKCLEATDLCAAKMARSEPKDNEYVAQMIDAGLVDPRLLAERFETIPLDGDFTEERKAVGRRFIQALASEGSGSPSRSEADPPHTGMVWVEGHWRDGYWVDGYWRSRPTR